jgi:hypothetical protein
MEHLKYMPVNLAPLPNEVCDMQDPVPLNPTMRQRPSRHKIGIYALCVFGIGFTALVLALGLITFLWKGVGATSTFDETTAASLWRTIMLKAWVARVITLSSLVIRVVIAAQAGICTSMLAALLLERSGVPIPWVAEVSIMRSSTTGPHHLATTLLQARPHIHGPIFIPVLCMHVLTTLLSQFCSTALLSDLKPGMIVERSFSSDIPYGYGQRPDWFTEHVYHGIEFWATKPASYPIFAELSEPSIQTNDSFYTGKTIRAMLPFSNPAQRSLIQTYAGMAFVANLQTVCVRPSIEAKVSLGTNGPKLEGQVSGSPSAQILKDNSIFKVINEDFKCTIPEIPRHALQKGRSLKEWRIGICRVTRYIDRNSVDAGAFLFVNLTKDENNTLFDYTPRSLNVVVSGRTDGVWQHMTTSSAALELSVSLCWIDGRALPFHVEISSHQNRTEPTLGWDLTKSDYDTVAIRTQLGALKGTNGQQLTTQERGILDLKPNLRINDTTPIPTVPFHRTAIQQRYMANDTAAMCYDCEIDHPGYPNSTAFWVHRAQIAVFQDILTSTYNPALALQAQYWTLLQMSHYDLQPEMDVTAPATLNFFGQFLMPKAWNGYIAVAIVLFVHVICVIITTTLFLGQTQFSLLGNTWSAIAQVTVSGSETAKVALTAFGDTDKEVRRRIGKRANIVVLSTNTLGHVTS